MRCYNGCPDSELQKRLDTIAEARKKLKRYPGANCTYFPKEGKYQVSVNYMSVPESWCDDELQSIERGIEILKQRAPKLLLCPVCGNSPVQRFVEGGEEGYPDQHPVYCSRCSNSAFDAATWNSNAWLVNKLMQMIESKQEVNHTIPKPTI